VVISYLNRKKGQNPSKGGVAMLFILSRTRVPLWSREKPCEEAVEMELTLLDYRMVPSIEEAKKKVWFKEWFEGG